MLMTFGSELTSLINSDPAWKVSKGSRSASRRARKTIGKSLKNCTGLISRSSDGSNMPVSESEKHGVSVLGCRFSEKAEHVPIKKRRFLLRSPSPPSPPSSPPRPVMSSPPRKEIADLVKSPDASSKHAAAESASCDINLSQVINNDTSNYAKKSEKADRKFGEDEDFSGISILAAAACSSSLGKDCGYAEDGSGGEECSMQGQNRELCSITEERSSSRGLLKEDLVNSSEMSTGGTSSCVSTEPVGELASFSTSTVGKGIKDSSLGTGSLTLSGDVSCSKDEETMGNQRLSSRDDRLHWDLNVVMDAWEQPFDDSDAQNDIAIKNSQDGGKCNHDDYRASFEGHDAQDILATTHAQENSLPPRELRTLPRKTLEGNENHDVDVCDNVAKPISLDEERLLSSSSNGLDAVKCMVEDTKCVHSHETLSTGGLAVTSTDHASQPSTSSTMNEDEDISARTLALSGDRYHYNRPNPEGLNLHDTSEGTCGTASADIYSSLGVSSSSDIKKEVAPSLVVPENIERSRDSHDNDNAAMKKVDLKISEPLGHSNFAISSTDDRFHSSCNEEPDSAPTKCELLIALDTTKLQDVSEIQGGKLVCNNKTTMNFTEIPQVIAEQAFHSVCHESREANTDYNSSSSDKIVKKEPHDHCSGVDVYSHSVSVAGTKAETELQVDDESQYEDGELIETNEHAWEEYYVDRDAEHVHNRPENIETCTTNPTDYQVPDEPGQVEVKRSGGLVVASIVSSSFSYDANEVCGKTEENNGGDETCVEDSKVQLGHSSEDLMKAPRPKELLETSKNFSHTPTGVRDDNRRNETMPSVRDGVVDSRDTDTREESRAFRRGLRSQIEGPVACDVSSRDERLNKMDSRYDESSSMRSFERVRYPFHNQGRGRQGDWDGSFDGRRGIRRHYSPILRGRSKLDDDAILERDNIGCVDMQRDTSYSHQLLPKNRAGTDEDACAGLHSRCKPDRKLSPDRAPTFGRGRSFRYGPSVDNRAGRGRYNGPSPDESFQSSLKYRRPLSRRERSISPFGGRGHSNAHHSRGKSPSRSRSRSPVIWQSQRGRPGAGSIGNTFLRHRSRSPNFRSEVRLHRLRSPHHQPNFGGDHAVGFRSMSRNHGSPPRSRWTASRKDDVGNFREFGYKQRTSALERSPGRIRLRGDRAGVTDSSRNFKPDGYYRISDRISEDGAGRGLRYEDNFEDRRKNYGPLRPARRSYEDGMASRLHPDVNDSFPGANNIRDRDESNFQGRGLRGMDCRIGDMPRRFRGEQPPFMYERDGKFNSNAKQFGIDLMDASRNLQPEDQYPSTHTGRFNAMNGPNRGRRYENYEDRRKQYGATNLIRRNDTEGMERRLNHNVDENFQDAPGFRGRGTRNFDGRIGSLSTRIGEDQDAVVCGQEEKLDDNVQPINVQKSDDNDTTKESAS